MVLCQHESTNCTLTVKGGLRFAVVGLDLPGDGQLDSEAHEVHASGAAMLPRHPRRLHHHDSRVLRVSSRLLPWGGNPLLSGMSSARLHQLYITTFVSPWRLFHISGSPWTLPFSSPASGQECWRPSAHSSWYLFWWCPCILVLVFIWASHLLSPCPVLFLSYGFHLYVWHVHTRVVASASGVLLSAELLPLSLSLHFLCRLSG